MATLLISHRVRDFDAWKAAFDSDPVGRAAGGVRSHRVSRQADDPSHVVIELELDTVAAAEAFAERLRALWVEAGPRLGLESPTARVLETVETHSY
jgi:hypothetical protein